MSKTRNEPEFQYMALTKLWRTRREYAMLSGFYFMEVIEEKAIQDLSIEEAIEVVAEAEPKLAAFKEATKRRRTGTKTILKPGTSGNKHEHADGGERRPSRTSSGSGEMDQDGKPGSGSKRAMTSPELLQKTLRQNPRRTENPRRTQIGCGNGPLGRRPIGR
jgi:hypothetical protein